MSTRVIIKPLNFSYKQACAANAVAIVQVKCSAYNTADCSSWSVDTLQALFKRKNTLIYATFLKQQLIGYIIILTMADEAEILDICVDIDYQKQGIASHLINQCQLHLNDKNINKLFLEVRKYNVVAKHLYQKLGFVQYSQRKCYYQDGEDALLFVKNLNQITK